jgi:catechol 2,3-dioxygenase-like lactoylglutathione lyase family enzyme
MKSKQNFHLPFLENGIAQVAILVPDLIKAIKHYHDDFGIGPWHIYTYGKPLVTEMSYYGQPAEYKMRIGLSYFGQMRIELIQPLSGETVYSDFIEEHGYGVHHFGLLVDDMESALDLAAKAGYEMIMDGSGFGLDGDGHYAYLDTEDALGVTLELIDRPERRFEPEAVYPPEGK